MYLIRITPKGGLNPVDDGIVLVPQFKRLLDSKKYGVKMLTAVAMFYDYQSPFRLLDESKRKRRIAQSIWGQAKMPRAWNDEIVKDAIHAYKELQVDPIREHLEQLKKRLKNYDAELNKPLTKIDDMKKRLEVETKLDILKKKIEQVTSEVASRTQEIKIKGDRQMSWLEEQNHLEEMQRGI